jgi:hypothetical protein
MEQWRPIPGWEGLYSVSDQGRVRSERRTVTRTDGIRRVCPEKILKSINSSDGRLHVSLCDRPKRVVTKRIHQLVLLAFVGPCPEGMEVLHWDDNSANNRLSNLRYGTRSENQFDSVRNGRHPWARRTHCPRQHPYDDTNTVINSKGRRECRTCERERGKAKRAAKRASRIEMAS